MAITKRVKVTNPLGLQWMDAAKLVLVAARFRSVVQMSNGPKRADAKSILGLLTLGAVRGIELEVVLEGEDAGEAWEAIRQFFNNDFGDTTAMGLYH